MEHEYKTLEELEAKRAAREAMKQLKQKKRKRVRRITALCIAAVIFVVVLGVLGNMAYRDINGLDGDGKSYVIDVPAGAGSAKVASLLGNRGVIKYPALFKMYAGNKYIFQRGRHSVNSSMTYDELLKTFGNYAEGGVGEQVQIVIPEGYELGQIADILVQNGLVDKEEFMDEVNNGTFDYDFVNEIPRSENRLEGYLYPATYQIYPGTSSHDIIIMMLDAFKANVLPVYNQSGSSDPIDQVVTMASVIEREAANDGEKKLVASVFNNRLYEGKKLESCATVQYLLHERKTVLSIEDTEIDSPYNTYKYKGLPEGPIASPGLASIKAALKPADTNYMYFLADPSGNKNYFSQTYDEHQEKMKLLEEGQPVDESTPTPSPTEKAKN